MKPHIYYRANPDSQHVRIAAANTISQLQEYGTVLSTLESAPPVPDVITQMATTPTETELALMNDSDVAVLDLTNASALEHVLLTTNMAALNIPMLATYSCLGDRPHPLLNVAHPKIKVVPNNGDPTLEETVKEFMTDLPSQFTLYPNYVIYDSIDGGGKGAVHAALTIWAKEHGLKVFDHCAYMDLQKKYGYLAQYVIEHDPDDAEAVKKAKTIEAILKEHADKVHPYFFKLLMVSKSITPTLDEVEDCMGEVDFIMTAEPTYVGEGDIIRNEIISSKGNYYSGKQTATTYDVDRSILDQTLIIPALKAGKFVSKDRSVTTSEHYQTMQGMITDGHSFEMMVSNVRGLPGNRQAFSLVPGQIYNLRVSLDTAQGRLKDREKSDNARYEIADFQKHLIELFESERMLYHWTRKGTLLHAVNVGPEEPKDVTVERVKKTWEQYMLSL